jgi:hypothetical protein
LIKDIKITNKTLKNIINSEVDTPDGKAVVKQIYITELGYLMVKLFYKKSNIYQNIKIGDLESMLQSKKISLKESWIKKIELV